MKAGIYNGSIIELKEIVQPKLEKPDDVLIEVKTTGICGSDLRILHGIDEPQVLPIGHELSGLVVEVNDSKFENLLGKKVAVDTVSAGKACGTCRHCMNGQYTYCINKDLDSGGAYAEYIKRRVKGCFEIRDDMNFDDGALVEPLAVAVHALRKLSPSIGDNLLILGSGTIGLMCLYVARQMNFNKIFITSKYKHQKNMANYLGADYILDYKDPDIHDIILSNTDGYGFDMSLETVGSYSSQIQTLTDAVQMTKNGGKIGVVGGFRVPVEFDFLVPYMKGQSLIFPICYNLSENKHDFEVAINLYNKTNIDISKLVTKTFNFNDIENAFNYVVNEREEVIKVHLKK